MKGLGILQKSRTVNMNSPRSGNHRSRRASRLGPADANGTISDAHKPAEQQRRGQFNADGPVRTRVGFGLAGRSN